MLKEGCQQLKVSADNDKPETTPDLVPVPLELQIQVISNSRDRPGERHPNTEAAGWRVLEVLRSSRQYHEAGNYVAGIEALLKEKGLEKMARLWTRTTGARCYRRNILVPSKKFKDNTEGSIQKNEQITTEMISNTAKNLKTA